jgi:hypothetical protein
VKEKEKKEKKVKMEEFDPVFYLTEYKDLSRAGIRTGQQALQHFIHHGEREGRWRNKSEKINRTVLHVLHSFGGGTEVYVDNLISSFPLYNHVKVKLTGDNVSEVNGVKNMAFIFIHSLLVGGREKICKNVMEYLINVNVKKFIIIHDYHLLYPTNPGPERQYIEDTVPFDLPWLQRVFSPSSVDRVYFNSENTRKHYERYITSPNYRYLYNVPDIFIYSERIPYLIKDKHNDKVNMALLGNFQHCKHKGGDLARKIFTLLEDKVNFYIFGEMDNVGDNITVLGKYRNETIYNLISAYNISGFFFTSLCEETYSYTLSIALNTGLPIFYHRAGAYIDRLKNYENCYPYEEVTEIRESFLKLNVVDHVDCVDGVDKTFTYELSKNIPELPLRQQFSFLPLLSYIKKRKIHFVLVREERDIQLHLHKLSSLDFLFLLILTDNLKDTYIYQDYRIKVIWYNENGNVKQAQLFITQLMKTLPNTEYAIF